MEEEHADLDDVVDTVLAVYRDTAHQNTGENSATLLLGRRLRDPLDVLHPPNTGFPSSQALKNKVFESQRKQKHDHDRVARLRTPFQLGDGVLARQPESPLKGYCKETDQDTGTTWLDLRTMGCRGRST